MDLAQVLVGHTIFQVGHIQAQPAPVAAGRLQAIKALLDATLQRCHALLLPRVYSKELVELIFVQPYVRIQSVVDAGLGQRGTASEYLRELEHIGILRREKRGREVLYRHPALLEVLQG